MDIGELYILVPRNKMIVSHISPLGMFENLHSQKNLDALYLKECELEYFKRVRIYSEKNDIRVSGVKGNDEVFSCLIEYSSLIGNPIHAYITISEDLSSLEGLMDDLEKMRIKSELRAVF